MQGLGNGPNRPSIVNRQLWRFIFVEGDEIRKKLAEKADDQSFVGEEPVVKSDFGDPEDSPEGYRWDPMIANEQDPMIAVERRCLEAVEVGGELLLDRPS